jgi:hypothetical protein
LLGEILKKKREGSGLDLREIAHTLKFQYEYLKALEDEDLKRLPPDVYVKAYIRGYAAFLNIDPLPLLDDYAEMGKKNSPEVQPEPPRLKKNLPFRKMALFAALIMVVGLTVVVFLYATKPAPPVLSPAAFPDAAQSSPSPPPPIGPQQHILEIIAHETTWFLIRTAEGISEEALLRPGETKKWTSESGFDLKVGNAGGIRMVLDNKDIGTPGEKGQVVKLHLPDNGRVVSPGESGKNTGHDVIRQ